ncbi:TatD family hydrolase [Candidatus Woesearchaeota archaeon]|nr:TatD family hydrolase [Candidatus Woesearchaeota archaeon]
MLLIDAHAHLEHKSFKDIDKVIKRAEKVGIKIIINAGTNPETNKSTLKLSKNYPIIKPALGIHPTDSISLTQKEIDEEIKQIGKNKSKIIAIGEIGLDHHWHKKEKDFKKQKNTFKKLLNLAEKLNKPVFIHSRNAVNDTLEILKDYKLKIILHSFEGNKKQIQEAIKQGYYFSIPTSVTRSTHFQILVKTAPLSKLLTETDAPFLAPKKDQRNEPSFITKSIKKIAEIKNITEKEAANNIFLNYQNLF